MPQKVDQELAEGWVEMSGARRMEAHDDGLMTLRIIHDEVGKAEKLKRCRGYLSSAIRKYYADRGLAHIRFFRRDNVLLLRGEPIRTAGARTIRKSDYCIGASQLAYLPHDTRIVLEPLGDRDGRLVGILPAVEGGGNGDVRAAH